MIITKPGIYDSIPMEQYHQQLTGTPSISSSGLRAIELDSPAHYYAYSYLNPEPDEKSSESLNFGKAAHALLIGEDHFDQHFVIAPFKNWNTNEEDKAEDGEVIFEWKSKVPKAWEDGDDLPEGTDFKPRWKAEQDKAKRTIIMPADLTKIHKMAAVLNDDPLIKAGILRGEIEKTIVWKDEETGIWLKARPDILPHDDWACDYKTAADVKRHKLSRSIMDYGYHMQMALIAEGLAAVDRPVPTHFVLLFQQSSPPYSVQPVSLGWELIKFGAQQNRRAMRTFADCLAKDEWPHPEQMTGDYFGPDWFHKVMQEEEDGGLLPRAPSWIERAKNMEAA